jgi:nucleoside-diphosphate-sugar epimerase
MAVTIVRPGWVWGPGDRTRLPALIREARHGGLRLCGSGKNLVSTSHVDLVAKVALAAARSPNAPGHVYHATNGELLELRELFGALSTALGLPPPVSGLPGPLAAAMSAMGRGLPREELVFRRRSTLFDASLALGELGVEPTLSIEAGMKALARWVESAGGLDALLAKERTPQSLPTLTSEANAAELAAADAP